MTTTTKTIITHLRALKAPWLMLSMKFQDLGLNSLVFLIIVVSLFFGFALRSLQLASLMILVSTAYLNSTLTQTSSTLRTWLISKKKKTIKTEQNNATSS